LRARRFRVDRYVDDRGRHVVAAERGFLREAGNLVFHLSLLVVLVGVALGALFGFTGGVIVVTGQGFANTLTQYDEFQPGARYDPSALEPFALQVEDFSARYQQTGPQRGSPLEFRADISYTAEPGAAPQRYDLQVNHPLEIDGTSVFLIGHGYAPVITVRDGRDKVVFSGPVTFLPQDSSFTSYGVVKAPDADPEQLAFEGYFLPTLVFDPQAGPISVFPDAANPALVLLAYRGNLGLDTGEPQSVYALDRDRLTRFRQPDGEPFRMLLSPGQRKDLPDGAGSIEFAGLDRWVKLQVSESPGKVVALVGVLVAIVGLLGSLFIRPRRTWLRAGADGGRTVVEVAGLDRSGGGDLSSEVDAVLASAVPGPQKEEQR
jgi:cytochrome c biogenesis protein